MNGLETALRQDFPEFTSLFTYRGTTAIYLALRSIATRKGTGEVVVPATVCPDVPLAVLFAGFRLRFCDVDLTTFCSSPHVMEACFGPETKAVIAVHLFGKAVRVRELLSLARPRGIAVIEDLAQSIGGEFEGAPLGSFGDFSILSLDHRKILSGRGGVLLSRDSEHAGAAADFQSGMEDPLPPEEIERLAAELNAYCRTISNSLRTAGLSRTAEPVIWNRVQDTPRLYIARPHPGDAASSAGLEAYRDLPRQRRERRRRYEQYARCLGTGFVRFEETEMCWRLPLLAPSPAQQLQLIQRIRAFGALASDHYFPASFLFGDASATNAREIGLRALNLWVDDCTDESLIPKVCDAIRRSREA